MSPPPPTFSSRSPEGGFPLSSVDKESACNAGDPGSIPASGRSPGEGNGHPLQYSSLENPMDRGAWQASVHGITRVGHDLATKPPPPEGRGTVCPSVLSRLTEGSGQPLGACMWNSQSETQREKDRYERPSPRLQSDF